MVIVSKPNTLLKPTRANRVIMETTFYSLDVPKDLLDESLIASTYACLVVELQIWLIKYMTHHVKDFPHLLHSLALFSLLLSFVFFPDSWWHVYCNVWQCLMGLDIIVIYYNSNEAKYQFVLLKNCHCKLDMLAQSPYCGYDNILEPDPVM